MVLAISILGAQGKMGQTIISLAKEDPRYEIAGGSTRPSDRILRDGHNFPPMRTAEEAMHACQVAIDFSSADIAKKHIEVARTLNKGFVLGTTGLDEEALLAIASASEHIPVLYSPNFSLGMALCFDAVRKFAHALFGKCYIDIVETHHVAKKDTPSGTALGLAKAVGKGRIALHETTPPRKKEEIVIHSIRSGNVIGAHSIIFECGDERIELTHRAHSRDAFARGALLAAEFISRQPPGLYSMSDLLNC